MTSPRYQKLWVDPEGHDYRYAAFNRQSAKGSQPLLDNPTLEEVRDALRSYKAETVLEVGCGWGRLLEGLADEFKVSGCDVSPDMLKEVRPDIHTFLCDIADPKVADKHQKLGWRGEFDVVFTRGVLHYLLEDPALVEQAKRNLMLMANYKVILWEYAEVCVYFADKPFFDLRPITHKDE